MVTIIMTVGYNLNYAMCYYVKCKKVKKNKKINNIDM